MLSKIIDEYELEALQHRVLSQNIKRENKRVQSSRRFSTLDKDSDQKNAEVYKEYKNFIRPSTSMGDIHSVKLLKSPNTEKAAGARFHNLFEGELKDVKTYKDLQHERHMGPLEINYKYKITDFYEKKTEIPTTATQSNNPRTRPMSKQGSKRTMKGFRTKHAKLPSKDNKEGLVKGTIFRNSSTGNIVESIPSKMQMSKRNPFEDDFCIENTLVNS